MESFFKLIMLIIVALIILIIAMVIFSSGSNSNSGQKSDFQYKQGHTIFHHDTMVVNGQNVLVPNMLNGNQNRMRGGYYY